MAWSLPVESQSFVSKNAISTQFLFVKLDPSDSNSVITPNAGDYCIGVSQDTPNAGDPTAVSVIGSMTKVLCGATITAGQSVTTDGSGNAVPVFSGANVLGTALSDGVAGYLMTILYQPISQETNSTVSTLLSNTVTADMHAIRNIGSVPIVLIPGVTGKTIVPLLITAAYTYGLTTYDLEAAVDSLVYSGSQDPTIIQSNILNNLISGQTASAWMYTPPSTQQVNAHSNQGANLQLSGDQSFDTGAILTTTLGSGGSGYAIGDTGNINTDDSASYVVDTVDGSGAVLTYHITNPGTGYTVGDGVATVPSSGSGSGFTINITAITPLGDGSVQFTTFYVLV